MPFTSTAVNSTSSATGQTLPTSSSRFRLAGQPTGRGFELSSARTASISPWDIVFYREVSELIIEQRQTFAFRQCAQLGILRTRLQMKNYLRLNLSLLYWIFVAPFTGQFFKIAPIFRQMVFIGVRAAPMVALTAFSVGVTLAMQAAHSLESLGAQMYIPDLVMLTLLREMGPVLIAVIVIGRSGSAVAAELGTMKVSEEIEALEVMAIDPVQFLVVPRFLAMMIMLPALTIFGNYIGILGGWAVCRFALDFNTAGFILEALESAEPWDLYSGMIKSVVFAWIVITIACNAGLTVEGGAEGVGQATTTSVVQALLAMLVMNAVLTGVFFFST
jgi:phospholipid/cholesterol/gamma-HCH transport system permease protein